MKTPVLPPHLGLPSPLPTVPSCHWRAQSAPSTGLPQLPLPSKSDIQPPGGVCPSGSDLSYSEQELGVGENPCFYHQAGGVQRKVLRGPHPVDNGGSP